MKYFNKNKFIQMVAVASIGLAGQVYGSGDVVEKKHFHQMRFHPQDPTVIFDEGTKFQQITFNTSEIKAGPDDGVIKLAPGYNLAPDSNGDFLYDLGTKNFDAISTFATTKLIFDMVGGDLQELENTFPTDATRNANHLWKTQNGYKPIVVEPFDTNGKNNAFYSRGSDGSRVLRFFEIETALATGQTCRSFDIVSHEAGHAWLDVIKSGYFTSNSLQTGAFHEANGDLSATIFGVLSQHELCEVIMNKTRGNLNQHSILNQVAEQFGEAIGSDSGLRDLDKNVTVQDVSPEVHAMSQVFSSVMFDVLAEQIKNGMGHLNAKYRNDLGQFLKDEAREFRLTYLQAVVETPGNSPTFMDIANSFINVSSKRASSGGFSLAPVKDEAIVKIFEDKGILGEGTKGFYEKLGKMPMNVGKSICATSEHKHKK